MRRSIAFICFCLALLALPAKAGEVDWGGAYYEAGYRLEITRSGIGDAFLAARRIKVESGVSGTLHAAAVTMSVTGDIGENLYGVAREISIESAVRGNALAWARKISVTGDISGRLRVASASLEMEGTVGSLSASVDTLFINGTVRGDAWIEADSVDFGDSARIGGRLFVASREEFPIPASVVPSSRVEFIHPGDLEGSSGHGHPHALGHGYASYVGAYMISVGVVFLMALVLRGILSETAQIFAARPLKTAVSGILLVWVLFGFSMLSIFASAGIAFFGFAATGIFLVAGSLVGAYLLGSLPLGFLPRPVENRYLSAALVAFAGVSLSGLLWSVPLAGLHLGLLVAMAGTGAFLRAVSASHIWRDMAEWLRWHI